MPCEICGAPKTVRSHIIPKAIALDIRRDEKNLVAGSRHHHGTKRMQGGMFSDDMLCHDHEAMLGRADTYGVRFVRTVNDGFRADPAAEKLQISNPVPELIQRFAIQNIWREVHGSPESHGKKSLGKYEETARRFLFEGGKAIEWPIIVHRTKFDVDGTEPIDYVLHPYRVKFADRLAWLAVIAGVSFFTVTDARGLPSPFDFVRADKHDPATVIIASESLPITSVRALNAIFQRMQTKRQYR